jgi:GDP-mannose 6-dehydrogenase
MRICVLGLGYVGAVTAACLAGQGHNVVGVDTNPAKAAWINKGESPIIEPGLGELISSGVEKGLIEATTDHERALMGADIALVTVGTPTTSAGQPDLSFVWRVVRQIGESFSSSSKSLVLVLRSTVPPGTLCECAAILRQVSPGVDFHLAFNPEFLREGSAVRDFLDPAYTVIGTQDATAERALRDMYQSIDAPLFVVVPEIAEMVKYVANAWHATKIAFSNEIGRLARGFGVDGREVMQLLVEDHKLNVSSAYMRPGFAFGGSCLPKDLASLLYHAKTMDTPAPLLEAVRESNRLLIDAVADQLLQSGARRIGVLGLAFKPQTDDLRESPSVVLCKRLIGEGCQVKIFDRAVSAARLMGTNLAYIREKLPHFEALLTETPEDAMRDVDVVVVTYATPEFTQALGDASAGTRVLDLAGLFVCVPSQLEYDGIAW